MIMFSRGMCCCCCSPSETYGRKWGDSKFQILAELTVLPQAAGVIGTFFNVLYIYIYSEHYGLSFLDFTDAISFTRSPFYCIHFPFCKYTLHVCYVFDVNLPDSFEHNFLNFPQTLIPRISNSHLPSPSRPPG